MFDSSSDIVVGLEIGTSKICAVVAELNEQGAPNIIGIGQCQSQGVRKAEITDTRQAAADVREAIAEAEKCADAMIKSVFLGVSGAHVRGLSNRGVHPIVSADREITDEDVQDVIKNAKVINIPPGHKILHAIRQDFALDGTPGIANPVGMSGSRLEVDVHVIHGDENRIRNAIRVVNDLQIEVDGVAFNGLAASLALLTPEQKEMGALVIDLGAGVTNYTVYTGGFIKHSGTLAVGGDHLSNDLAYGLKVPLGRAELLKVEYGAALPLEEANGQNLTFSNDVGLPVKTVNRYHLFQIMSARLEEIFQLIESDLTQARLIDHLRSGVYLCGGGARIPRIELLAEQVFQVPVAIGRATAISGVQSALDQPEFATAIGLVKYGAFNQKRAKGFMETIREKISGMIHLF